MKTIYFFTLCFLTCITIKAQDNPKEIAEATNFAVPSSVAFLLLDVNPTKVNKPGFTRDFKFDWIVQNNRLAPNIAIEAHPIWLIFYDKVNLSEYQKQKWLSRALSTLSVSLGTVERDTINSLAFGFKINLYRKADPLRDKNYIDKIMPVFVQDSVDEKALLLELAGIRARRKAGTSTPNDIDREAKIIPLLEALDEEEKEALKKIKTKYNDDNWNAALIDVGYGVVYNYQSSALQDLVLANNGAGLWINACQGIGRRVLFSSLFKYTNIAKEEQYMGGINFRFGSSKVNFWTEGVYESLPIPVENKRDDRITIGYGGSYRVSENFILQFGIRTEYDDNFNLNKLRPIVNFNYNLSKN